MPLIKKCKVSLGLRYVMVRCGEGKWRRRRDSNPRWTFTHAGFQDRCIQPLCHPSKYPRQALLLVTINNLCTKITRVFVIKTTNKASQRLFRVFILFLFSQIKMQDNVLCPPSLKLSQHRSFFYMSDFSYFFVEVLIKAF